jgi:hypothetical protein
VVLSEPLHALGPNQIYDHTGLYCIDQYLGKTETFCKAAMIFNQSEVMGYGENHYSITECFSLPMISNQ